MTDNTIAVLELKSGRMNYTSPRSLRDDRPICSRPTLTLPDQLPDITRSSIIESNRVPSKLPDAIRSSAVESNSVPNKLPDTTRSSTIPSHRCLFRSQHDVSQALSHISAEHNPELDVAKPQVPSTFIYYTINTVLTGFPVTLENCMTAIMSAQQPLADFPNGRETPHMANPRILTYEDHPRHQINGNQAKHNGITIPSDHQLTGGLAALSRPQDQPAFGSAQEVHSSQLSEDSAHFYGLQAQAWPGPNQNANARQFAETATHVPNPQAQAGSAPGQDALDRHFAQILLDSERLQPQVGAEPTHNRQSAQISMNTGGLQPQSNTDDYHNHPWAHNVADTHQRWSEFGTHEPQHDHDPHFLQVATDTQNFEPQNGFPQSLQAHNRQPPHMSIDIAQSRDQTNFQQPPKFQMSMTRLQPQVSFEQIQEAHNHQLAQISMNGSYVQTQHDWQPMEEASNRPFALRSMNAFHNQPQFEFAETYDASIPRNIPPYHSQAGLSHGREVHERQFHENLMRVCQSPHQMEFPRTQEALGRQVVQLSNRDVQSVWRNGLQGGPRPPFWDHGCQNFSGSQPIQHSSWPAQTVSSSPFPGMRELSQPQPKMNSKRRWSMARGSGGHFGPQPICAAQRWPSFYNQGLQVGPYLMPPPIPQTPDSVSQAISQSYIQPPVSRHFSNQGQSQHPQMLPGPTPTGELRPAGNNQMSSLAIMPPTKTPGALLPSSVVDRAASTLPHTMQQPPIGTPRASVPKRITATIERAKKQKPQAFGGSTAPLLPFYPGSDAMYPYVRENPSEALRELTANGRPPIERLIDKATVPFVEIGETNRGAEWGVIRIGNIPYSLTRAEVVRFVGGNAHLVPPELGIGVHIIMDRTTGKTMDCYIEFASVYEAQVALNALVYRGQPLRMGSPPHGRVVNVTMSSQDELLKQLFPRAKNVVWTGGKPTILTSSEPFNTGFKTFITAEELIMMSRHAEQPHRSSYTQKCPQRTYECMISTLAKFPWSAVELYTLATREQIFDSTREMLTHLVFFLKRGGLPNLDHELLLALMITGLNAQGFSEKQRWELIQAAEYTGHDIRISPLSQWWPWEVLRRKAGTEEDVVKYYAHLMTLHPSLRETSTDAEPETPNPFGGNVVHTSPDLTMAEASAQEWELFQGILRDVLPPTSKN